jgi:MYXO-CTERM domain-containing protein
MANYATASSNSRRRTPRLARLTTLAAVAVATASSWATPAKASIAYAYLLSSEFDFGGGCPSCHTNEAGGLGTVTKPFGKTMMKLGLVANNTDSLYEAVVLLSTSNDDSDGDTIADFDELSPDGDPNDPAVFPEDATPVPPAPSTPPPTTTTTPPTTTEPTTTPPTTTAPAPASTQAPAPAPSPAASKGDGGCRLTSPNGSPLPAAVLALLGLGLVARRRRSA